MSTRLFKKETMFLCMSTHVQVCMCGWIEIDGWIEGLNQWQHTFVLTSHPYVCVIQTHTFTRTWWCSHYYHSFGLKFLRGIPSSESGSPLAYTKGYYYAIQCCCIV